MSQMTPGPEAEIEDPQPNREREEQGNASDKLVEECRPDIGSLIKELGQIGTGFGCVERERNMWELSVEVKR